MIARVTFILGLLAAVFSVSGCHYHKGFCQPCPTVCCDRGGHTSHWTPPPPQRPW